MVYNKDLPSDCQQDQEKALDKEDGREEVKTFRSVGLCWNSRLKMKYFSNICDIHTKIKQLLTFNGNE